MIEIWKFSLFLIIIFHSPKHNLDSYFVLEVNYIFVINNPTFKRALKSKTVEIDCFVNIVFINVERNSLYFHYLPAAEHR